jgi:hypothetical protein
MVYKNGNGTVKNLLHPENNWPISKKILRNILDMNVIYREINFLSTKSTELIADLCSQENFGSVK